LKKAFKIVKNFSIKNSVCLLIDHGKSDELGSGPKWKKIARFKRKKSSLYFQNDLAFLGRIGKPSLSEFPENYGLLHSVCLSGI
jgi:hypothetical protein